MPIQIKSLSDSYSQAQDAYFGHGRSREFFKNFAEVAQDIFSERNPMKLNFEAKVEIDTSGQAFTVAMAGRTVRYTYVYQYQDKTPKVTIAVHLLPTVPELEFPLLLGEFFQDGHDITNLAQGSQPLPIKGKEDVLEVLLHFSLAALSHGFCWKS